MFVLSTVLRMWGGGGHQEGWMCCCMPLIFSGSVSISLSCLHPCPLVPAPSPQEVLVPRIEGEEHQVPHGLVPGAAPIHALAPTLSWQLIQGHPAGGLNDGCPWGLPHSGAGGLEALRSLTIHVCSMRAPAGYRLHRGQQGRVPRQWALQVAPGKGYVPWIVLKTDTTGCIWRLEGGRGPGSPQRGARAYRLWKRLSWAQKHLRRPGGAKLLTAPQRASLLVQ
ncbi:unnamed protein product [Nyctereutes procyonoides]|uniref:(raccoon dog) hypothetical protein n=1 Tax=Nyctereutes procyonoides TaxID=34880 RepID=A0A811ZTR0_NYCPR|nr:unnamed protein product [Nyctereutes procyonoides]